MPTVPEPFDDWEWEDTEHPDVPTVDDSDRSVVGILYGPDGDVLSVLVDKQPVVGFAAWLCERDGIWPATLGFWGSEEDG